MRDWSPPSRGRGSKLQALSTASCVQSPPAQGRGSKHAVHAHRRAASASPPARGRGSKPHAIDARGSADGRSPLRRGVDRNTLRRIVDCATLTSPLARGRGSKPDCRRRPAMPTSSPLARGRGSKLRASIARCESPPRGAWIETAISPARGRPFAGAWIETSSIVAATHRRSASPLARGRGSKLTSHATQRPAPAVAPCTGAWIETHIGRRSSHEQPVAPCAGAWIETSSAMLNCARDRRPLRGGVDRNYRAQLVDGVDRWSPPARGRGSKRGDFACVLPSERSPLHWGVDRNKGGPNHPNRLSTASGAWIETLEVIIENPKGASLPSPSARSRSCSRAQTPPRFIGDSTWMSRTGSWSETEPLGIRVFASSMMRLTAASGSSAAVRKASGRQRLVEVGGVAASLLTRLTANWRGGLSPTSLLAPSTQPSQGTRVV